jgi:hypothetical protein
MHQPVVRQMGFLTIAPGVGMKSAAGQVEAIMPFITQRPEENTDRQPSIAFARWRSGSTKPSLKES